MVIIRISLATKDCQSLPHGRLQRSSLISIMVAEEIIHGEEFISLKMESGTGDYLAVKVRWKRNNILSHINQNNGPEQQKSKAISV